MKQLLIFFIILFSVQFSFAEIVLEQRKLSMKNYSCSKCHDGEKEISDKVNLPLTKPHTELKFKHMESIVNCYSCHDKHERDFLRLNTGEKIDFDQSYRLCFQCHGEKKSDWMKGTHGKQIGSWNGDKYKFVCTSCHEAHHPKFRIMKADPGPKHPRGKKSQSVGGHH